jgi:hypothetical protein
VPARMQMYFFIDKKFSYLIVRSKHIRRIGKLRSKGRFVFQTVCVSDGLTGQLAVESVDTARQGGLF